VSLNSAPRGDAGVGVRAVPARDSHLTPYPNGVGPSKATGQVIAHCREQSHQQEVELRPELCGGLNFYRLLGPERRRLLSPREGVPRVGFRAGRPPLYCRGASSRLVICAARKGSAAVQRIMVRWRNHVVVWEVRRLKHGGPLACCHRCRPEIETLGNLSAFADYTAARQN
jgi:hypothetical protein